MPAIKGHWRKGMNRADAPYLPLTPEVVDAHLRGEAHIGLYRPIIFKNRLVQCIGHITRPYPSKTTATVHDYHDEPTPVIASSLKKLAASA